MPLGRGLLSLIPSFPAYRQAGLPTGQAGKSPVGGIMPTTRESSAVEGKDQERIWHIPLSSIKPNPYQPRQSFSHQDLEELINSIKVHGVIQPLLVSEIADGNYELITGERRWRSAQILGLPTVPALIRPVKDTEKLELALIENIQRKDLNPIEEAFAFERLIDEFGLTHEEIAQKVGKSRPYVSNMLRLLTLPAEIQKGLIDGVISQTVGRAILGLAGAKEQLKTFRRLTKEKSTVQAVEEKAAEERFKKTGLTRRDLSIIDYERKLREALGTKVRITKRGERGSIKIDYYSTEELKRILGQIIS